MNDSQPSLLHAEGGIYAFYKPAGMWVHPAQESNGYDLLSWIQAQEELPKDLALAHRLDRETSGIVLCTDNSNIRGQVGIWFREKQVSKHYLALVYGVTHRKGIIRRPLSDQRRGKALEAITRYRCKKVFGKLSLLDLRPETGRKHQIRRHLQEIGHPVVGDRRYRSRKVRSVPNFPERLWLHSSSLSLPNGFEVTCPLPTRLEEHLAFLQALSDNGDTKNNV